jgi:hypothetical protein
MIRRLHLPESRIASRVSFRSVGFYALQCGLESSKAGVLESCSVKSNDFVSLSWVKRLSAYFTLKRAFVHSRRRSFPGVRQPVRVSGTGKTSSLGEACFTEPLRTLALFSFGLSLLMMLLKGSPHFLPARRIK